MLRIAPRISISKLAEYIVASPRRKRRILLDAMDPPTFKVAPHRRARSAILWSSRKGGVDDEKLLACADRLRGLESKGKWDSDDLKNSIAAIERFMLIHPKLDFGSSIQRLRSRSAQIRIEGVDVSVTPNLVIRGGTVKDPTVGAIKLYFVKTNPLSREDGDYTATILRTFVASRLEGGRFTVDSGLCQVVDVFADQVFVASPAFKRRMDDVAAACDSIRRLWHSHLLERPDYQAPDQPFTPM